MTKGKRLAIIMIAAVLVAAVAALGLVLYGVLTHREGGLLLVCWDRVGYGATARYVDEGVEGSYEEGACERPRELVWAPKQIPLTVLPSESRSGQSPRSLPEDDFRSRALKAAINDINGQLGFRLFKMVPPAPGSSVFVFFGTPMETRREGAVHRPPSGSVYHSRTYSLESTISIRSDVEASNRLLHLVLVHELLHVAGLAHDNYPSSIMFPLLHDDTTDDVMRTQHISWHDRRLLRRMYRR
jgi:hypothetical protein